MSKRAELIDAFLNASKWKSWTRVPIAGDASSRRYERLYKNGTHVILMDDPVTDLGTTSIFENLSAQLLAFGLCPPEVLSHDPKLGLMILSDLGPHNFSSWLADNPQDGSTLYRAATDVLIDLQSRQVEADLLTMTPAIGGKMVEITAQYYLGKPAPDLATIVEKSLLELAPIADTLALRDFHAENLIWRPERVGFAQVGLLDFQDAFIAPRGYDLVSLLRDVRRDVEPNIQEQMISYFIYKSGKTNEFRAQLACLGAQRNLRILGVFARLAKEENKRKYLSLLPRVWKNLQADLRHPELATLRQAVNDLLIAPDAKQIRRLTE